MPSTVLGNPRLQRGFPSRLRPTLARRKNMIEFARIHTQEQISNVVRLAREIWTDHYTAIIGREQVDYMLDKFQSERGIAAQLADGYEYYTVLHEGENVGYIAIVPDDNARTIMISKIYVRRSRRGHGFGRAMLEFAEDLCRKRHMTSLCLTVNKNNTQAIAWYMRMGFKNVGSVVQDIGTGFVMDDYRMEKSMGQQGAEGDTLGLRLPPQKRRDRTLAIVYNRGHEINNQYQREALDP